jgi:hypothetical protein
MKNEQGFVLPFVMMISTLLLYILIHQVTVYVTEIKFYKEKLEVYALDRILQKSVKELQHLEIDASFQNVEIRYDEGNAIIQISASTLPEKTIKIKAETKEKRKTTVIVHYDTVHHEIVRWIEGR